MRCDSWLDAKSYLVSQGVFNYNEYDLIESRKQPDATFTFYNMFDDAVEIFVDKSIKEQFVNDISEYNEHSDNIAVVAKSSVNYLYDYGFLDDTAYTKLIDKIDHVEFVNKVSDAMVHSRDGKPLPNHMEIYVEGSYNAATMQYGYGAYMDDGEKIYVLSGRGVVQHGGNNVEGEVAGTVAALRALSLHPNITSVTIHHNYEGIGKWADKAWKADKVYTQAYSRFVDSIRKGRLYSKPVDITYEHVKGYSNNKYNYYVDAVAKQSCGVPITATEKAMLDELREISVNYKRSVTELPKLDAEEKYTAMGDYMP